MADDFSHLYFPLAANPIALKAVAGASVLICEPDTCTTNPPGPGTPIAQPIFSDAKGVNQIANPRTTNADGVVECYARYPQSVDLFVTGTNLVTTIFRWDFTAFAATP